MRRNVDMRKDEVKRVKGRGGVVQNEREKAAEARHGHRIGEKKIDEEHLRYLKQFSFRPPNMIKQQRMRVRVKGKEAKRGKGVTERKGVDMANRRILNSLPKPLVLPKEVHILSSKHALTQKVVQEEVKERREEYKGADAEVGEREVEKVKTPNNLSKQEVPAPPKHHLNSNNITSVLAQALNISPVVANNIPKHHPEREESKPVQDIYNKVNIIEKKEDYERRCREIFDGLISKIGKGMQHLVWNNLFEKDVLDLRRLEHREDDGLIRARNGSLDMRNRRNRKLLLDKDGLQRNLGGNLDARCTRVNLLHLRR